MPQQPNLLAEFAKQAVDLDPLKSRAERTAVEDEASERERMTAAVAQAHSWDKAMRRAFKGIVSSPARHRMLREMQREVDRNA